MGEEGCWGGGGVSGEDGEDILVVEAMMSVWSNMVSISHVLGYGYACRVGGTMLRSVA